MTPGDVARLVERRHEAAFVELLRTSDREFSDAAFEPALADALRSNPALTEQWTLWSGDQRWTPSARVDGVVTTWVTAGGAREEHLRGHIDEAAAVADFIHRMAAWLARGEVLVVEPGFSRARSIEGLVKSLDAAISLLDEVGETHWSSWLANDQARIRSGDMNGVEHLLQAFGGMGSLNDVVLPDRDRDDRLWDLRQEIHDAAEQLRRKANRPG